MGSKKTITNKKACHCLGNIITKRTAHSRVVLSHFPIRSRVTHIFTYAKFLSMKPMLRAYTEFRHYYKQEWKDALHYTENVKIDWNELIVGKSLAQRLYCLVCVFTLLMGKRHSYTWCRLNLLINSSASFTINYNSYEVTSEPLSTLQTLIPTIKRCIPYYLGIMKQCCQSTMPTLWNNRALTIRNHVRVLK